MFLLPKDTWEMHTRTFTDNDKTKRNRGIFAKKDIAAGSIIGDYIGLIIPEKEEDDYEDGTEMYLMYYDEGVTIFPNPEQPGIHVLNHSCEPNSWMYTYKGHTLYFALRKIFKGEELTVSYQLSPLEDDCEPCIHTCHCHTPSCTGTMHMEQKKYDIWRAFDDAETEKTKTAPAPVKQQLSLLDQYPEEIKDDPVYKLFGAPHQKPKSMPDEKLPSLKTIRKEIRTSGRMLSFPKLHITIRGTEGKDIFATAA
jgi:hypothetical protein